MRDILRRIVALSLLVLFLPACEDVFDGPTRKPCQQKAVQTGSCGDIDEAGRCDGATVLWCGPNNNLMTVNCWDAGFEGCAYTGALYDCYSQQESFDDCVERVNDDCFASNHSGLCDSSANSVECEQGEDAATAACVEDQIQHGACH